LNKSSSSVSVNGAGLTGLESHAHFAASIESINRISDTITVSGVHLRSQKGIGVHSPEAEMHSLRIGKLRKIPTPSYFWTHNEIESILLQEVLMIG
jgi:hypothetical protein